jgi:tetratricopeptide (TPR) repeat protein
MAGSKPVTKDFRQTVERVRALIAAGEHRQAADICEQAAGVPPTGAEAFILNGLLLAIRERGTEAVSAYDRALALAPDALAAYMGIADILAGKGWLHSAIVVLETGRQACTFTAEAETQLAELRERLEREKQDARVNPP